MASTHTTFGERTEVSVVAQAFPDRIRDKVILITGVNIGGIGGATAEALSSQSPRLLILAGRSPNKVQEVVEEIHSRLPDVPCRILQLDLASQKSCRLAAQEILDSNEVPQVDILINNAGIMNIPERTLSEDGIELQLATNHIGHFLFTNLIMPKILKSASASTVSGGTRIINVSSRGVNYSPFRFSDHNFHTPLKDLPEAERANLEALAQRGLEMKESDTYEPMVAYGQSKTANVLFSLGLNEKLYASHGILSFALHPGAIMSELGRYTDDTAWKEMVETFSSRGFHFKTLSEGASTTLVAALDPKLERPASDGSGVYLSDCQIAQGPVWIYDVVAAQKLWELSEKLVGQSFSI